MMISDYNMSVAQNVLEKLSDKNVSIRIVRQISETKAVWSIKENGVSKLLIIFDGKIVGNTNWK